MSSSKIRIKRAQRRLENHIPYLISSGDISEYKEYDLSKFVERSGFSEEVLGAAALNIKYLLVSSRVYEEEDGYSSGNTYYSIMLRRSKDCSNCQGSGRGWDAVSQRGYCCGICNGVGLIK
jgi:hypothetical protein